MSILRFVLKLLNIEEALESAADSIEARQAQVRENVLTIAYHVGFANFWYEKTHYPSLYVAYTDECFRKGQEEAAIAWRNNRYFQKAALIAFVDRYMDGWNAAQELDLGA